MVVVSYLRWRIQHGQSSVRKKRPAAINVVEVEVASTAGVD